MEIQISDSQKQLILGYKGEAMEFLSEVEAANTSYKEIVTAAAETTKLPKGIISKYFKACFNDKTKQISEEADIIEFLNN